MKKYESQRISKNCANVYIKLKYFIVIGFNISLLIWVLYGFIVHNVFRLFRITITVQVSLNQFYSYLFTVGNNYKINYKIIKN